MKYYAIHKQKSQLFTKKPLSTFHPHQDYDKQVGYLS